jgi:hypothetical protein
MYRFLTALLLTGLASVAQAGFFELTESSVTSTMYIDVVNNDGNNTVGVTDIVRSVQRFTYADAISGSTRTGLAISITEVASENTLSGLRNQYLFKAATTAVASGPGSISSLVGSFSGSSVSNLEATGVTGVSSDVFALLTASGDVSLSAAGFNFDSAAFGLDTTAGVWSVDMTAAFASTGTYQEWRQNFVPPSGSLSAIDPETYPGPYPFGGGSVEAGDSTGFKQLFSYTITQVKDDNGVYTAGSGGYNSETFNTFDSTTTAGIGINSQYDLNYGVDSALTQLSGTNLSSENVVLSLPAPGAVPEPQSMIVMAGMAIAGLVSRRRRR